MLSFRAVGAVLALTLLVPTVPALARDSEPRGYRCEHACSAMRDAALPRLHESSAINLIDKSAFVHAGRSWSVETPAALSVRPVMHNVPEPRVTSVPVALIVGGLLIASLGITQWLRRTRMLES